MTPARPSRFLLQIDPGLIDRIDDYRFAHRISSRAEAMRRLLALGLAAAGVLGEEVPLDQVIARLRSASED